MIGNGVDDGPIIVQKKVKIGRHDDATSIRKKITDLSSTIVVEALDRLNKKGFKPTPQDEKKATFAPKRIPEDGKINWKQNTENTRNLIRSLTPPYPGLFPTRRTERR